MIFLSIYFTLYLIIVICCILQLFCFFIYSFLIKVEHIFMYFLVNVSLLEFHVVGIVEEFSYFSLFPFWVLFAKICQVFFSLINSFFVYFLLVFMICCCFLLCWTPAENCSYFHLFFSMFFVLFMEIFLKFFSGIFTFVFHFIILRKFTDIFLFDFSLKFLIEKLCFL